MEESKNTKKTRMRNDILLIAALLLIAVIGIVYLFFFRDSGDKVNVTVDGKLYATYALSEDRTEEIISGKNGENRNLLVIKDGRVRIERASCPDGICVSHHAVFRDGESIVCLPNRVVITVVSSTESPDTETPDIIS